MRILAYLIDYVHLRLGFRSVEGESEDNNENHYENEHADAAKYIPHALARLLLVRRSAFNVLLCLLRIGLRLSQVLVNFLQVFPLLVHLCVNLRSDLVD